MTEAPQSKRSLLTSKWSKIRRSGGDSDEKHSNFTDSVSDFLNGNGGPQTQSAKPNSTRPFPRLDLSVAQRWPGATELQRLASEEHKDHTHQPTTPPVKTPIIVDQVDDMEDGYWAATLDKHQEAWYPTLPKAIRLLSRIYRLVNVRFQTHMVWDQTDLSSELRL